MKEIVANLYEFWVLPNLIFWAVGVSALPYNVAVEVEGVFEIEASWNIWFQS